MISKIKLHTSLLFNEGYIKRPGSIQINSDVSAKHCKNREIRSLLLRLSRKIYYNCSGKLKRPCLSKRN